MSETTNTDELTGKRKRKIVILGGGPAALAAAFELTTPPRWSDSYEVAVYQIGWRLGGKCATGRGPNARIEEHGTHVLMGWYNNTFWMIKEAYAERQRLGLAPRSPFQTWQDGFVRDNTTTLIEYYRDRNQMYRWSVFFPENKSLPGEMPPTTWDVIGNAVGVVISLVFESPFGTLRGFLHSLLCGSDWWQKESSDPASTEARRTPLWPLDTLVVGTTQRALRLYQAINSARNAGRTPAVRSTSPDEVQGLMDQIKSGGSCCERAIEALLAILRDALKVLAAVAIVLDCKDTRRALTILELGVVVMIGILEDVWDPATKTFRYSRIEHLDFREWLKRHGASENAVEAGLVRFIYAGAFSNLVGHKIGGLFAAGTALRAGINLLAYKGSLVWEMAGGTADTVVAPVYQVLAHRGVDFKFFHEVESVHWSATGEIEKVTVGEQVKLKTGKYEPLVPYDVKDGTLDCWPIHPLYEQIDPAQAKELQERHIDLESPWADWTPEQRVLVRGVDFDDLILCIPIAALRDVCSELYANDQRWAGMIDNLPTTPTISMQIWLKPTLKELGLDLRRWGLPRTESAPNVEVCVTPHTSWSDLTFTLPYEQWKEGNSPQTVAYFCGACTDFAPPAPYSDHQYPDRQVEIARIISKQWLSDNTSFFWPRGTTLETPRGLDLRLLVDPDGRGHTGDEKFGTQYFRANVSPSERYTLAVPFYHQYRMRPDDTGFKNLYVAGDWVWHQGVNAGFFEGAVTAGREAAQDLLDRRGLLSLRSKLQPLFVEPDVERPT